MNPSRKQRLPWREIDGRAVVVQPIVGQVHELNGVGTFLWKQADGSRSLTEIIHALTEAFEIDAREAESDVQEFYQTLEKNGLIQWTSPGQ